MVSLFKFPGGIRISHVMALPLLSLSVSLWDYFEQQCLLNWMELEKGTRECQSVLLSTVRHLHAFKAKLILQDLAHFAILNTRNIYKRQWEKSIPLCWTDLINLYLHFPTAFYWEIYERRSPLCPFTPGIHSSSPLKRWMLYRGPVFPFH